MSDVNFDVELLEDPTGARLTGELDLAAYEAAERALASLFEATDDVVLDVSRLEFVDSSGIRLFIRLHQALGENGSLILRSPTEHVARVLEIAGLPALGVKIEDGG
ncbi:MAG TPA: STAS domain-containing protein [Actinomycetota bacterium]|nr:STAS domain-containing protein [Actinomycetota bacterium]